MEEDLYREIRMPQINFQAAKYNTFPELCSSCVFDVVSYLLNFPISFRLFL